MTQKRPLSLCFPVFVAFGPLRIARPPSTHSATVWQAQRKRKEAYDLLAPVYSWFTEGFDTKDLIEAKALIAELTP
jgi:predicted ATPase